MDGSRFRWARGYLFQAPFLSQQLERLCGRLFRLPPASTTHLFVISITIQQWLPTETYVKTSKLPLHAPDGHDKVPCLLVCA